ncbi:MAG: NADP-dependent malic enzyme [Vicinamibacterales bacterium]
MAAREQDALDYHELPRPGKTEVVATKPCLTARDLSLAYSPGVAVPCLEIASDPDAAYRYTNKANLVAVLSNGTAVLGLGDIGALAGKPVMEGKGVLFKRFAGIDVFDINVDTHDPDEVIKVAQLLEPTFGGINLEDIKAPECFYIEETLKRTMGIPVFHDDQHGTAIISGAALLNALEIVGKNIAEVRVVVSGAGASAIACAKFYEALGVPNANFLLVDTKGVVYEGRREGMNPYKAHFAQDTRLRTLAEAMRGADVFLGCSVKGLLTQDMVRSMAERPIVFAMANPDPEISYEDAKAARPEVIMATGRSDYPNQVNNVLGFPFIFRGALDVRASAINEEMKMAAARALAQLAREPVPEDVAAAYSGQRFEFGPEYIIPKPFDPRILVWEATAVARAACDTGVARAPISDWEGYRERLASLTTKSGQVMRTIFAKAKAQPKRVVFPDGQDPRILEACRIIVEEKLAQPILLGNRDVIAAEARKLNVRLEALTIIEPGRSPDLELFARELYQAKPRRGFTPKKAHNSVRNATTQALMMLRTGRAEGMVAGIEHSYVDTLAKVLPLVELKPGVTRVMGVHLVLVRGKAYVFADTTVNIETDARMLAEIAVNAVHVARYFNLTPRVAMLSFTNFGANRHPQARKVQDAVDLLHRAHPEIIVDGEMQGDVAINPAFSLENFPESKIQGDANVLIFPDVAAGNICYKLVKHLSGGESIGPMLVGPKHPINVVNFHSTVRDIVHMAALSAYEATA